jgi:hypothetical protein
MDDKQSQTREERLADNRALLNRKWSACRTDRLARDTASPRRQTCPPDTLATRHRTTNPRVKQHLSTHLHSENKTKKNRPVLRRRKSSRVSTDDKRCP